MARRGLLLSLLLAGANLAPAQASPALDVTPHYADQLAGDSLGLVALSADDFDPVFTQIAALDSAEASLLRPAAPERPLDLMTSPAGLPVLPPLDPVRPAGLADLALPETAQLAATFVITRAEPAWPTVVEPSLRPAELAILAETPMPPPELPALRMASIPRPAAPLPTFQPLAVAALDPAAPDWPEDSRIDDAAVETLQVVSTDDGLIDDDTYQRYLAERTYNYSAYTLVAETPALVLDASLLAPAVADAQPDLVTPTWQVTRIAANIANNSAEIQQVKQDYSEIAEGHETAPVVVAQAEPVILPGPQVERMDAPRAEAPPAPEPAKTPVDVERLAEAILLAVNENPDIQISKARQDDAYYGVMETRAGFLPKVDLALSAGPEFNVPSQGDNTFEPRREGTLSVRQTVWDFGLTLNDLRRAKALYQSAEWATREKIEAISFEIATAYIGVLERERVVGLARDNVAAHKKILKMVEIQKELGLSTGADVSRVQARLSNVEASLLDRESERDQAKENYRRLVKRLPGTVIDPPAPESSLPLDADAAVELIDERSPQLMQTLSDQRSLQFQRRSQIGNYFPKVEVEAQGNWKEQVQGDTGRARDARAMINLRYNIFNGLADHAVKKRIDARIREIEFEVERVRREVEQDIRSDFRALMAARQKVATVNSEVEAAQKVVDLYAEQFKTGKRTAFDLLDGQQALLQAKTNAVANRYQSVVSGYRVLQKLGLLFDHISAAPNNKI